MIDGKKRLAIEILAEGTYKTYGDVAEQVGITDKTLREWRKDEEFQRELTNSINSRINSLAGKALKKMNSLIDDPAPYVALTASKDILDRAGYKPNSKVDLNADVSEQAETVIKFEGDLDEWSK